MVDIRIADGWWDNLPPDRRIQIWQWVAGRTADHPEVEGQFEIPIPLHPKTEARSSRR